MADILEKIKEIRKITKNKLEQRRMDMADQDGPNVSRYITATRWLVEQEIEDLDKELNRLDKGIKEITTLIKDKNRISGKYFVSDNFECLELGIISKNSKVGREILEKRTLKKIKI